MAIFKCKMCGGSLEIGENETVAVCEYCGTKQTLPKLDSEKIVNLYDRANHFRLNNDYDKAINIYEQILAENSEDAEAYWSILLCRYGIEYVEENETGKRIPTVNRAQYTSVFDDEDYKSAIKYADENQREVYQSEAETINEIQKGILEISQNEDPFDIFICYKETDKQGRRIPDSVLATELYYELKEKGFKVFFSRITLENKLGTAYEPYIFAALHSAKVMVVLGTKKEYFNSVWVKNEWSRFLDLIKKGEDKVLIPAYKDMDPYDLPEEFSHLQAQDMSKLGFMQDLVHGIEKFVSPSDYKEKENDEANGEEIENIDVLIDRAFLSIEETDYYKAEEFIEKAMNIEPKNAKIYVAKLLIEMKLNKVEDLSFLSENLELSQNFERAIRFGDEKLVNTLKGYNDTIIYNGKKSLYNDALNLLDNGSLKYDFISAKEKFDSLKDFENSVELSKKCDEKLLEIKNSHIYSSAAALMKSNEISSLEKAFSMFSSIKEYKDSKVKSAECEEKIKQRKIYLEKAKKRLKLALIIIGSAAAALILILIIYFKVFFPKIGYKKAEALYVNGEYMKAYRYYQALNDYKDSNEKETDSLYNAALIYRNEKNWNKSNKIFEKIKGYKDSETLIHYHDYKETVTKEATCTEGGIITYICDCGDEYTKETKPLGHDFAEANCTEPKKCKRCGLTQGNPLGHTNTNICTRCSAVLFDKLTFSGSGPGYVKNIKLPAGKYNICGTFKSTAKYGGGLFYADFYEDSSDYGKSIASKQGNCTTIAQISIEKEAENAYIDVEYADGNWTFTIEACK